MRVLLNFSNSKGNQTVTFDQLIEYSTRNKKSYTQCGGETIPRTFPKEPN